MIKSKNKINAIFFDASGTLFLPNYNATQGVDVYPDSHDIIEAVRLYRSTPNPIKFGIITNWTKRVKQVIKHFNLTDCFDIIVSCDDVSHGKPANDPFLLAAACANAQSNTCIHIGDSLRDDVFASADCGFISIWVNRNPDRFISPAEQRMLKQGKHIICNNLHEVLQVLKNEFGIFI